MICGANAMGDKKQERIIMLADCQSFYATVEKVAHPELEGQPLVVAGDPERRSGIILAACPIAKQYGIKTAEKLGEAIAKCPNVAIITPRMEEYIKVSLQITAIYQSYTDLVEPYSIDEQHLDVTGSVQNYHSTEQMAYAIQRQVMRETGVRIRIGISSNKVLSKMACDHFAKQNASGLFHLPISHIAQVLWPLPIGNMFMVGRKMKHHLQVMGIHTIGELARTPLATLRRRWGVNGEVLWRIANGIDDSPVSPMTHIAQKGIGHHMTLPVDYETLEAIKVPLLELTELVCQRARMKGYMGSVVSVGCRGADFDHPTGFHRQKKLDDPTYLTDEVYSVALELLEKHWDGLPVRSIGVTLNQFVSDEQYQMTLFDNREERLALARTTDSIKARYGNTAIMRASSLTAAGQAIDRAGKIGGHYK